MIPEPTVDDLIWAADCLDAFDGGEDEPEWVARRDRVVAWLIAKAED